MSALANALNRIRMMLVRGVLSGIDSGKLMQLVQIRLLADETKDGVEFFEPYGITAVPHAGAEYLGAFIGGSRSHGVVFVIADRRYRLVGLEAGEVALYTDENQSDGGHRLVFRRDQKVELYAKEVKIVAAEKVEVETQQATVQAEAVQVTASTLQVTCPDIQFN